MLMRQLLQALLDRFKLGGGFTLLAGSEAGEVFRKDDQACALRFALPDQRFNDSEVRFNIILGIHLGCGKESHNRGRSLKLLNRLGVLLHSFFVQAVLFFLQLLDQRLKHILIAFIELHQGFVRI